MKKISLLLFFIFLFSGIKAQEETISDRFIIGGSINFITQNNTVPLAALPVNSGFGIIFSDNSNDTKNTAFSFNPYLGKELNAHWLLGIQLNYRLTNYTAENAFTFGQPVPTDFNRKTNSFGFGLFGRYTLNPAQRFHFFLQPYAGYNLVSENSKNDDVVVQEEKANYFEAGVGLGILYPINSNFRATLRTGGLNYLNGTWKIEDTDTEKDFSSFGFNLNFSSIFLGVEMRF